MKKLIKIGTVQKTHGLKGELTCDIQITPDDFDEVNVLFIKQKNDSVPYFISKYSYNQNKLTVLFEEIKTVDNAKQLLNAEVWVEAKYVTEDEYIWVDQIMGYDIIDVTKGKIGIVENFYKIPNNDLLATEINGKEVLIPANTYIVKEINDKSKTITVDLPEGLIEIYLTELTDEEKQLKIDED